MLMTNTALSDYQALSEFHEILRYCADWQGPSRDLPVRYQICRMALIGGGLRSYLPGFVPQCVSLYKFREFITLYDNDPARRVRFLDRALDDCWTQLNERPSHDMFDTFDVDDF